MSRRETRQARCHLARVLLAIVPTLASILLSHTGQAAPYDFVVLATASPGPFTGFPAQGLVASPSLDADGSVAFVGQVASGRAVFVASHPSAVLSDFTQVTDPTSLSVGGETDLGRFTGGALAFIASTVPAGEEVVDRWTGSTLVPLLVGFAGPSSAGPAVNALGTLAYSDDDQLFLADAQGSSVLFQQGDQAGGGTIDHVYSVIAPDIDDAGDVAFGATGSFQSDQCNEAVLKDDQAVALGNSLTAGQGCDFDVPTTVPLAINASGSVAYVATIAVDIAVGDVDMTVFVDQTKVWHNHAPGFDDSFMDVTDVAIGDRGTVAFRIEEELTGWQAVYTGEDRVADKVLATGDPLCGSTVTAISFQRYGINASDQLALAVELADARALIVRAEPSTGAGDPCKAIPTPEPDSQMLAVTALVALLGVLARQSARRRPRRAA